jgi:hypothetical protein
VLEIGPPSSQDPPRVELVAEEPDHRREQRHRSGDGHEHHDDRTAGEGPEDRGGHDQHAGEGQDHHHAAEEHGSVGGGTRCTDRIQLLATALPLLAVSRHDEERVVDPDRQTHHRDQVRSEEAEPPHLADQSHDPEGHGDREDRQDDGRHTRHQGPEHDHQHDQRRRDPDAFADAQILLGDALELLRRRGLPEDQRLEP